MIKTKQDLLDGKIKFNINKFIKSRIATSTYFKYFYDEEPIDREFDFSFIELPRVNRVFA